MDTAKWFLYYITLYTNDMVYEVRDLECALLEYFNNKVTGTVIVICEF